VAACVEAGDEVFAVSHSGKAIEGAHPVALDLRDHDATRAAVAKIRPDAVYHLAGQASVALSWEDPRETMQANVDLTLGVLEAVRHEAHGARLLAVGSGEIYGPPASLPVGEDAPLRPQNPYAVSKASADVLAGFYADAYGLNILRARAFNHAGPGQAPIFVVSSLARQAAQGLVEHQPSVRITTGNADARRDFTDVRDVVHAYRLLVERADPGAYNVCSGSTSSAAEIIAELRRSIDIELEHVVDPSLVRANEVLEIRGDNARLRAATGWEPEVPFEQTVGDTLAWWREELAAAGAAAG
jgi:GDP-4-dehydro-6-deoxy-D-mannose reductase